VTAWLLLALGGMSLWATVTAIWRIRRPAAFGFGIMAVSWLTGEYPLFHIAWQIVATAVLVGLGGLDGMLGQIGLAAAAVSWVGLALVWFRQSAARPTMDTALRAGLGDEYLDVLPESIRATLRTRSELRHLLRPFHNDRSGLVIERNIRYGDQTRNVLDVYRPENSDGPLPVIFQIHGGGWVIGHKAQQGLPLLHRIAHHGYVGVSINYRLAPRFRFPDQLIDVKRAIAWTRDHIAEYGGDPDLIIVTGGSAGGHLASLAALTPTHPEFQPGFEDADTSVAGCMPFYGPTDFTNGDKVRGWSESYELFLRHTAMPGPMKEMPDLYEAMSPISHVSADAPPFLIIQGSIDVLVWKEENRIFAERLTAISHQPVVYWEVPGAQHAFDFFHSRRSSVAVDACERFAGWVVANRGRCPSGGDGQ